MSGLPWEQVLAVMAEATSVDAEERRVLLVLADRTFHVREVLPAGARGAHRDDGLLGFVVYQDDPELAQRTDETSLLFVRPDQVVRIQVLGFDPQADGHRLGFGASAPAEE